MKLLSVKAKCKGLTLIEVLAVLAILFIIAVLFLPALSRRGSNYTVWCMHNQKLIAIGFTMWKTDNNDQFPWQVATTNGGAQEAAARGYAASSFQCLSNYLRETTLFMCRTDTNRIPAANFAQFRNKNNSYFISLDAGTNAANNILTGDRNLANGGGPLKPGLFIYSRASKMNWTRELHGASPNYTLGVFSFGDTHAEAVQDMNLDSVFQRENLSTNRLAVP